MGRYWLYFYGSLFGGNKVIDRLWRTYMVFVLALIEQWLIGERNEIYYRQLQNFMHLKVY